MPAVGSIRIDFIGNIANLISGINKSTIALERFGIKATRALNSIEKTLEKTGSKLSLKVTAPIVALGVAAVKAADGNGEFADSLQRLALQTQAALRPLGETIIKVFNEDAKPAIESGIKLVNGLSQAFKELEPAQQRMIIKTAAIVAGIGPALLASSSLITVSKTVVSSLTQIVGTAKDLAGVLPGLAKAAIVVGVAFTAYEFGRHIYDEFKLIQQGGAYITSGFRQLGAEFTNIGKGLWSFAKDIVGPALTWVIDKFAAAIEAGGKLGAQFARALGDNTLAKTLEKLNLDAASYAKDFRASLNEPTKIAVAQLEPLVKQLQEAFRGRSRLNGELQQTVLRAMSGLPLVGSGGIGANYTPEQLEQFNQVITSIADAYTKSGEESLALVGKRLSERRDEVLKNVAGLPGSISREITGREYSEATRQIAESLTLQLADIDKEFKGKIDKGDGFWGRFGERMGDDLLKAKAAWEQTWKEQTTGPKGWFTGIFDFFGRASQIAKAPDFKLPKVDTNLDLEKLEEYRKMLLKLRGEAMSIRIDILPEEQYREAIDNIIFLRQQFPTIIDDEVFAKKLDAIKQRFLDVLPVVERIGLGIANTIRASSLQASDALAEFAVDGKSSLGDLIRSIEKQLISLSTNEAIFKPLFKIFGDGIAGLFSGSTSASISGRLPDPSSTYTGDTQTFPTNIYKRNAHGNIFSGGALVPFARGGLVSSPTAFPIRGGRTGIMGEAGPEAIMPLRRIGNDLGVRATASPITINIIDQRQGGERPQVSERSGPDGKRMIEILITDTVKSGLARGTFDGPLNSNFGLNRSGRAR